MSSKPARDTHYDPVFLKEKKALSLSYSNAAGSSAHIVAVGARQGFFFFTNNKGLVLNTLNFIS